MVEINLKDPVLTGFFYYSGILVAKVLFMVFFTSKRRYAKKVFLNPEDIPMMKKYAGIENAVCKYDDKDVEKTRSTHWNDLENIPLFIFVGFVYVSSEPDPLMALNIFKTYMWSKIIYSTACIASLPQSTKDIACVIGYLLTIYMAIVGAVKFY